MPFHFLKYKSSNLPEIEAGLTPQGTLYRLMPLHLPFISEVLMLYMESILLKACYIYEGLYFWPRLWWIQVSATADIEDFRSFFCCALTFFAFFFQTSIMTVWSSCGSLQMCVCVNNLDTSFYARFFLYVFQQSRITATSLFKLRLSSSSILRFTVRTCL